MENTRAIPAVKNDALTVVIPTLDEERAITSCLETVLGREGVTAVVSDGGSTDRTLEIVRSHPDVRLVTGVAGRGGQLNRGAAVAHTPLLLFLHADCRLPCGWLEAIRAALRDPAVALACFRLRTESSRGEAARWYGRWLRLLDLRSFGPGLPYGDQGFALRREVFESLGGFADMPLMEDVELGRRCRRLGRIRRIPMEMRTTARRFEERPWRTRLMTASFPLLFRMGVSPERLAAWYGRSR